MIESYPLCWPEGWKRTERGRRERSRFRITTDIVRRFLQEEARRLKGDGLIISTNVPIRHDGNFYASAKEPDDPGVAVYFNYHKKPMCFACDRHPTVRENLHSIAATIEALRAIERYGASDMMERAFRGFTAIEDKTSRSWREVLGFKANMPVTAEDVASSFRRHAQGDHPDKGGDPEKFRELIAAREQALAEIE